MTVAATLEAIHGAKGLRVLPDRTLHDAGPIDVFLMPGGKGTRRLLGADEPLHVALRGMHDGGTLMTSVCTGSLVYAAVGLLRNRARDDVLGCVGPAGRARPDDRGPSG
ncbi:MAG TPA: DJ-1/PfpI family protein [Jatrophihabitans sp.]|nr:DJ-1/PfpI family protein [Jatrophihabitans sp.]